MNKNKFQPNRRYKNRNKMYPFKKNLDKQDKKTSLINNIEKFTIHP